MRRVHTLLLHLGVCGLLVFLDLWSKAAVFRALGAEFTFQDGEIPILPPVPEIVLFPGFALEAAMNPGAFNGMLSSWRWLLLAISIIAAIGTLVIALLPRRMPVGVTTALGLIAGGAIGNLYDRIHFGAVRDFVKWYVGERVWPNFNLADSGICVGVGLILFIEIRNARRVKLAVREAAEVADAPAPPAEEPTT